MEHQERPGRARGLRRALSVVGALGLLGACGPINAGSLDTISGGDPQTADDAAGLVGERDSNIAGKKLSSGAVHSKAAPDTPTTAALAKSASDPLEKPSSTTAIDSSDTPAASALRLQSRRSTTTTAPPPITTIAPPPTPTIARPPTTTTPRSQPTGVIVNVTDFGAVPNDAKDDQDAIQRAIDSAPPGATVVFAPGAYLHRDVIEVHTTGVTLWGYGASLDGTNRQKHSVVLIGNKTSILGFTIFSHPTERLNAEEQMGISIRFSDGSVVRDNTVRDTSSAGIFIWGASNYAVLNNVVENTQSDGIHSVSGSHNGLIEGNRLRNVGDDCFAVISYIDEGLMTRDITIRNNSCVGGKARGLSVVGGTDVLMIGNRIEASAAAGVYLASEPSYDTYAAKRVQVIANTFIGVNTNKDIYHGGVFIWGRSGSASTKDGTVYSLQNEDILIRDNTITNTVVGSAQIVAQGADSRRVNIAGNVLTGSKSPTRIDLASNQYNLVRNTNNGSPIADHIGDASNLP